MFFFIEESKEGYFGTMAYWSIGGKASDMKQKEGYSGQKNDAGESEAGMNLQKNRITIETFINKFYGRHLEK
ncbi:hypothetical protein [Sphingobacterium prati]|uniref:hypothetical protein n=1 Tax=Sphingobacterium prati TaxID=2737006 RepID=UPI0015553F4A|nr:hypothetical protein [Sphingobacterium prati]NPE48201.1 hypothetical protein [Sphingobacterium prati]